MNKTLISRIVHDIADGLVPSSRRQDFLDWMVSDADAKEKEDALRKVWDSQPSRKRFSMPLKKAIAIAAMFLIPLSVGLTVLQTRYHYAAKASASHLIVKSVPNGHIQTLILSDGTTVTLNSGSRLSYPENFGDNRNVTLLGEATFKVSHDNKRPFVVSVGGLRIEDVGTYFDVRGYEDENPSVTLSEGSVCLYSESAADSPVSLSPGEKACYDRNDKSLDVTMADIQKEFAWTTGSLEFKNEKLSIILNDLERKYDVEISCSDNVSRDEEFTLSISSSESFDSIIDVIVKASGEQLGWKRDKNKVFIYKRK